MGFEHAGRDDHRRQLPPRIEPIKSAPNWAGEHGDGLLRLTRLQAESGIEDPRFRDVDPLIVFTAWFGAGDAQTKPSFEPSMGGFDPGRVRMFRPSWGSRRLHISPAAAKAQSVTITFTLDGVRTQTQGLDAFDQSLLYAAQPMRDFSRRLKQSNKPVAPWLHTVGHHVGAESHHERTLMMVADYHPAVHYISGQPFTLVWPEGGSLKSHTPDVAILGRNGPPLIVDVRTPAGAVEEVWEAKVPAIRKAIESLGMGYAVWTGMSRPYRRNLENFTEARVPSASYAFWSLVALDLCTEAMPAAELADHLEATGYHRLRALTLIRRMLWRHLLRTDMFAPFTSSSIVERTDGQE